MESTDISPDEVNVDKIVARYLGIYGRVKEKVSHEHVGAVVAEIGKELRMKLYKQEEESEFDEPATKKQINLLKSKGVDIPPKLTKEAASKKIEEVIHG